VSSRALGRGAETIAADTSKLQILNK